ncbi:hypothetical protein N7G274_008996 [Stereocaulon virgatum]|uniref:Uncharacterized protein n=1 Tax=Stereocaulon virgatum TaxID=373712 RepID=A0ABR3ZXF8_9LECA
MRFLITTNETVLLPLRAAISLATLLDGQSLNASLEAPTASCASSPQQWPEWFQPSEKFDWGDVGKALDIFFNDYVRGHGSVKYEFLLSHEKRVRKIPTQRLPLKVEWGTCVVAIAMRSQFKQGELPFETPSPSALSDVASFEDLWRGLQDVAKRCSYPFSTPGWYPAGDLNSIAVFIWQAVSPINKRIGSASGSTENFNYTSLDWMTGGYDGSMSTY